MATSFAAFYNKKVTLGHVEAGLRTYNKYSSYPEEINRQVIGVIADMHFASTEKSKESLISKGKTNRLYMLLETQQ